MSRDSTQARMALDVQRREVDVALASNAYPSVDTAIMAQRIKSDGERHSMALRLRMNGLQALFVSLAEEKEKIDRLVIDAARILLPIRRRPQEILEEIFIFYVATISIPPRSQKSSDFATTSLSKNHPARVASQVCTLWRRMALSITALWNTIIINLDSTPSNYSSFYLINQVLER